MGKFLAAGAVLSALMGSAAIRAETPQIFQSPSISRDRIAFGYADDLWIVPRAGGTATRLTSGVGIEAQPVFSPDGSMIAFNGEYDGNIDVYVMPVTGGVPTRITYHPSPDIAVGWSPDGRSILFRSNREASSRYAQLYLAPVGGGPAARVPLPMAYSGQLSPDGAQLAYTPLAPAFGFSFTNYTAWGNYRGGRAGTIWLTGLPGLDSRQIPHEDASDFAPVFLGGQVYFLSGRSGRVGIFRFDPAAGTVAEVYHNTGADIRSLATDGQTLVFDRLGEIYTLAPGGAPQRVAIAAAGDMPDVRPRMLKVADEVQTVMPSATGLRAVIETHGEILTVPVRKGAVRNLTNSPGVMEREPAWSPDGQSIAYFSDEDGLYALHVSAQTAEQDTARAVRKIRLAAEPAYYFKPLWSPDSSRIAFYDNRLNIYVVEVATGRMTVVNEPDTYGGFSTEEHAMAWSPDSRWLVYPHATANHQHVLMLYSLAGGTRTALTDAMADAQDPAFDRNGKYLYFLASTNAGATMTGLDMTANLYAVTRSIYALALAGTTPSPVAPESDDEKSVDEARAKARGDADATPAGQAGEARKKAKEDPGGPARPTLAAATRIDLAGLSTAAIARRTVPLPLAPRGYSALQAGKPGTLYFLEREAERFDGPPTATLSRWVLDDRKKEELTRNIAGYELTADGEKMLIATLPASAAMPDPAPGGDDPRPTYAIVPAEKVKADAPDDEKGELDLAALSVRTDPKAEWAQMYREVWRIQRAYFYDPGFHGLDTVAAEKRYQPYVDALQSRADLNYVFQEMLTGFSVGHLRGSGGAIPSADKVPGGLLGADYVVRGGRYCFDRIYAGSPWSPQIKAPLGQPGLNVTPGECILAIDGRPLSAATDIQAPLEGTAGKAVTLRIAAADGAPARDIVVVPARSEADLRNLAWIEDNRRKVDQLSGGKLAYVYLPDTGEGGFTAFNRSYFAQTDKQGAIIDERFNAGGQVADYVVEVLGRKIESYWSPRYGQPEHAPGAAIYGPKVMIANEISGSGGDALPWLFKQARLGPLVGKRTWGGLVGISDIPVLMDGGEVTSPSVAFFSSGGAWDVENHGVAPDYAVEQDPKAVAAGHDPQLETAVALAMKALAEAPPVAPKRPAYPVYR